MIDNQMADFTEWFIARAAEDASVADFLTLFTLEFILKELSPTDQKIFIEKYAEDYGQAFDFAAKKIDDFENRYTKAFAQKIMSFLDNEE